jgi:hypothetical protein
MHAGVEHDPAVRLEIEQIRIGADFVAEREIRKNHHKDIPKSSRDGYNQIATQDNKMKLIRPRLLLFIISATSLVFATSFRAQASAEDQVDQAVAISKTWVSQIDAGKYEDSYSFTCDETRDRVSEDRWVDVLKALRPPWGAVIDRHQMSHVYKPNGVPGLNGECVVITYSTKFKNLDSATETVVLKWEDGKWRGAGYHAAPTVDPNAAPAPVAENPTKTYTEPHARPEPSSP